MSQLRLKILAVDNIHNYAARSWDCSKELYEFRLTTKEELPSHHANYHFCYRYITTTLLTAASLFSIVKLYLILGEIRQVLVQAASSYLVLAGHGGL